MEGQEITEKINDKIPNPPRDAEVGTGNTHVNQEETYENWMIVKNNYKNRKPTKYQPSGNKEKKLDQETSILQSHESQRPLVATGSHFAAFNMEEDSVENEEGTDNLNLQREELATNSTTSLGEKKATYASGLREMQRINAASMGTHQEDIQFTGQDISANLLKGKNIMEKFIKTKGREKASNPGVLKTNSGGIFKS